MIAPAILTAITSTAAIQLTLGWGGVLSGGDIAAPGFLKGVNVTSQQFPWVTALGESGAVLRDPSGLLTASFSALSPVLGAEAIQRLSIGLPIFFVSVMMFYAIRSVSQGRQLLSGALTVTTLLSPSLLLLWPNYGAYGSVGLATMGIVGGYSSRVGSSAHLAVAVILGALTFMIWGNPVTSGIGLVVGALLGVLLLIDPNRSMLEISRSLGRFLLLCLAFLLGTAWWLPSTLLALRSSSRETLASSASLLEQATALSVRADLVSAAAGLSSMWRGVSFPYSATFTLADSPWVWIASLLFLLAVPAIPIVVLRNPPLRVIGIGIFTTWLTLTLLAMGPRGPFRFLFTLEDLFNGALFAFREPYTKLAPVQTFLVSLMWALIASAPMSKTLPYVKRRTIGTIPTTIAVGVSLTTLGLFVILPDSNELRPYAPKNVHVPVDLSDELERLELKGKANTLILPSATFYQVGTSWGDYATNSLPSQYAIPGQTYSAPGGYDSALSQVLSPLMSALSTSQFSEAKSILSRLGVNTILVRRDVTTNAATYPSSTIETALANLPGAKWTAQGVSFSTWELDYGAKPLEKLEVAAFSIDQKIDAAFHVSQLDPGVPLIDSPHPWGEMDRIVQKAAPRWVIANSDSDLGSVTSVRNSNGRTASSASRPGAILARFEPIGYSPTLLINHNPQKNDPFVVQQGDRIERLSRAPREIANAAILELDEPIDNLVVCQDNVETPSPPYVCSAMRTFPRSDGFVAYTELKWSNDSRVPFAQSATGKLELQVLPGYLQRTHAHLGPVPDLGKFLLSLPESEFIRRSSVFVANAAPDISIPLLNPDLRYSIGIAASTKGVYTVQVCSSGNSDSHQACEEPSPMALDSNPSILTTAIGGPEIVVRVNSNFLADSTESPRVTVYSAPEMVTNRYEIRRLTPSLDDSRCSLLRLRAFNPDLTLTEHVDSQTYRVDGWAQVWRHPCSQAVGISFRNRHLSQVLATLSIASVVAGALVLLLRLRGRAPLVESAKFASK